jgi:hypothetical protein
VRKKISVGCADWRLVDAEKKFEVWTDLKVYHGWHIYYTVCTFSA